MNSHSLGSLAWLASTSFTAACGLNTSSASSSLAATNTAAQLSLQSLYSEYYSKANVEATTQRLPALRALSVAEYYHGLLAGVGNEPVTLAGYTVTNLRDRLQDRMPGFEALAELYPTLGELWDAANMQPQTQPSAAAFTATFVATLASASGKGVPSAALVDDVTVEDAGDRCSPAFTPPIAQSLGLDGSDTDYVIDSISPPGGQRVRTGRGTPMGNYLRDVDAILATSGSTFQNQAFAQLPGGGSLTRKTQTNKFIPNSSQPRGLKQTYSLSSNSNNFIGSVIISNYPARGWGLIHCYQPAVMLRPPGDN